MSTSPQVVSSPEVFSTAIVLRFCNNGGEGVVRFSNIVLGSFLEIARTRLSFFYMSGSSL
jgi:hypothetical protein